MIMTFGFILWLCSLQVCNNDNYIKNNNLIYKLEIEKNQRFKNWNRDQKKQRNKAEDGGIIL